MNDELTCPLSLSIFRHPVLASDSNVYEYDLIKKIIDTTKISPITKKALNDNLVYMRQLKNVVEEYLKQNPDKKEEQYEDYIYTPYCKTDVGGYFTKNYSKILTFSTEIQKECFDNIDNLEYETKIQIKKKNNMKIIFIHHIKQM